jgi:hypothetical protein
MMLFVWFWTAAAAMMPTPAAIMDAQTDFVGAQIRVSMDAVRPLMTLGWADEDDVPIF